MKICRTCGSKWRGEGSECPLDGAPLDDAPDDLVGRTVAGRYVITERVGAGGMGTVYRGRHQLVGRDVALKILSAELAPDPVNRERFLREARAANRIDHPNVLGITDCGETEDGLAFLVMDFLDGEPLGTRLARGPLPAAQVIELATQIVSALARAHELGVIHRDIKPDNIFLVRTADGGDVVKLLDFGLATVRDDVRLTVSGTVFGTPEYMAPEQARGMRLTGQADLYALGCVLFEMLVGEPPFRGSAPEVIVKHIRQAPASPSARVPGVPEALSELVLRLLEKDPEARPAGAAAVLDALRALAAGAARPEAPLPAPSVEPERSWSERIAAARELLGLAHPHGIPSWVSAALQAAVADAEELVRLRAELDRSAERLRREDPATREARVQLGAAVEVLARDEARCLRELEQLRGPLEEHRARAAALGPALQAAWAGLPAAPGTLSVPMAELLRNVGQLAGMWLEAARAVETLDAERSRCEREREDLRYQLVHLEGRLAALGSDLRAEPLEHAATQVEGRLVEALRQVADHLAHSPALAERARRLLT